jgi:hypothetical protein
MKKKMGMNWSKVGKATIFDRGSYLDPGHYRLKMLKMYTIETRNKGFALIVELEVLESSNDNIPVGATKNWYQGLNDKDIGFSAIKEFMMYLLGIRQKNKEEFEQFEAGLEELMEESSDEKWKVEDAEDHPLHGHTILVECFMKKTKSDADFTQHKWDYDETDDD